MLYYTEPTVINTILNGILTVGCIFTALFVFFCLVDILDVGKKTLSLLAAIAILVVVMFAARETATVSNLLTAEKSRTMIDSEVEQLSRFVNGHPVKRDQMWWLEKKVIWPKTLKSLGLHVDTRTVEALQIDPTNGGSKVKEEFDIKPAEYQLKRGLVPK